MGEPIDILECPETREPLRNLADGRLGAADGPAYAVEDDIIRFAPAWSPPNEDGIDNVQEYYDEFGWKRDEQGSFLEIEAVLDQRRLSLEFTRTCLARLGQYFADGGAYLLDAGSGPVAHDELAAYGERFDRHICLDLSIRALESARERLGDRGVYLQADVARIPIRSDSVDAITCNHVIYQVPPSLQVAAIRELWRVLKPGGVCVAVYLWPDHQISRGVAAASRLLHPMRRLDGAASGAASMPDVDHDRPQSRAWFESQDWPFEYEYDTFRVVTNQFMRHRIGGDRRDRALLQAVLAMQRFAPRTCGKYGAMPAIVFRKP